MEFLLIWTFPVKLAKCSFILLINKPQAAKGTAEFHAAPFQVLFNLLFPIRYMVDLI